MNNKKALFFDIDGTLYDSSIKGLRVKTVEMLEKLSSDDNYDLYIASGRTMNTISCLDPYKHLFKGFVLANGQYIIIDNKVVYSNKIDYNEVNKLCEYALNNKMCLMMLTLEKLYINFLDDVTIDNFRKYINAHVDFTVKTKFRKKDEINQMWIFINNDEIDKLRPMFPNLNIIKWGNFGADIIPNGTSKGHGVEIVMKMMDYKLENTYAFGDSDNDTVMFEKVGTSICMGNGTTLAKEASKYICEDIKDEGLVKSINKYIIEKNIS